MMQTIPIQLPEELLTNLQQTPATFANEIKILAAVKLFELGRLSSFHAAQLAGMSRRDFVTNLGDYQVSPLSLAANK